MNVVALIGGSFLFGVSAAGVVWSIRPPRPTLWWLCILASTFQSLGIAIAVAGIRS